MKLRAIWKENSPTSKLLLTVGSVLVLMVFTTVLASLFASIYYGIPYDEIKYKMGDADTPLGLAIMKIIQTASSFGIFILPSIFLAFTFSDSWSGFLRLNRSGRIGPCLLVVVMMLAALPFINLLADWNSRMNLPDLFSGLENMMRQLEDKAAKITEKFLEMDTTGDLMVNLFIIAVLPAVGEELFFRGLLQRIFSDWSRNKHVGIWVTAVVFSALHGQFYGFVPRMILGGMFGYLLVWSGSLWIPILAHLVNNGVAVIASYYYQKGMLGFNPDKIGTGPAELVFGLLSIILCAGILYLLKKEFSKQENTIES